jgi:hypothetical protein
VGVAVLALLALVGCDRIGNPLVALGTKPPAPDEFQVISRAPLRMPTSVNLPEPRLGEPSPLEPNPNRDAVVALLGTEAAPRAGGSSVGEHALLSAADVAASNPEIRQTLAAEADAGTGEPYEPPSIFELIGAVEPPPEDAIDAAAEARRLQTEGVAAAPVDPSAMPAIEEEAVEVEPSQYPAIGVERRGSIGISNAEPAFD